MAKNIVNFLMLYMGDNIYFTSTWMEIAITVAFTFVFKVNAEALGTVQERPLNNKPPVLGERLIAADTPVQNVFFLTTPN